jgi:hypothetical protein
MAGWRQAIELALSEEDVIRLSAVARSRAEPASRVERARILLAYLENQSFFAVAQAIGVHHQTVQRCVERALAYGPTAVPGLGRSSSEETDDHSRSQGMDRGSRLPQGQGTRLSARIVADAASRPPCA